MEEMSMEDLVTTRYMESDKFRPFPFSKATTIRQCVKCFELLAREISDIAYAFDSYAGDVMFVECVLQDDLDNYVDRNELKKFIELKTARVNKIVSMIRNFIATGDVGVNGRSGYAPNVRAYANFVNKITRHVDLEYQDYNRDRTIYKPPVDDCYRRYGMGVARFNLCVDEWNARFKDGVPRANFPAYFKG